MTKYQEAKARRDARQQAERNAALITMIMSRSGCTEAVARDLYAKAVDFDTAVANAMVMARQSNGSAHQ
ncbi:hypothetical protein [Cupriavidus sp. TMH.W2]|uniref:hypothetical protein n=1 Tax=Cupriavidus sp. TMH.W2 TaxID=3434465 RepID=UPI003D773792